MTPRRLPDLDAASLAAMHDVTRLTSIRRTAATLKLRSEIQITIREAMRAVLPPDDPRRDPAYPFNEE